MASVNRKASVSANEDRELSPFEQLERTVNSCLLWEDNFYEDGISVSDRITGLMDKVTKEEAEKLVRQSKFDNKLRHTPLLLLCCMAKNKQLTKELVADVITRVDDMAELLSLYWIDGKKPLPKQMVKGMQIAFSKFDEYQFGKYKGDNKEIKLRDVIRIARPKPENDEQSELWKKIVSKTLATPDTWEVELSKSRDKKASWERLLKENRLGALAMLRNVRNMVNSGVLASDIAVGLSEANMSKILPFQIMACARINPFTEEILDEKLIESTKDMPKLKGHTLVMVDVSGSMSSSLSSKSDMNRLDAAKTMAIILREICESCSIFKFNQIPTEIPARRGFALADAIGNACGGTSIYSSTKAAFERVSHNNTVDRIVIITDEQDNYGYDNDKVHTLTNKGYVINIAPYENGVMYQKNSKWVHVNGFSENVIKFISKMEN
ncbi:MAG: TROVE domain-containing protein [Bacteroidales bacterium]|nr:TROVE domain-containing protein [Candidatus Scybalousia scybalohippi]